MGKSLPDAGRSSTVAPAEQQPGNGFVEGVSPSMCTVEAVIRELAQSDVPVLLLAERGVGKHTTAQHIHALSRRSSRPFHALRCANLQAEELRGAGSNQSPLLSGGTVYLGEIAELNLECQERLLESLAKSEDGGTRSGESARLICGSARDLEVEVKARRLREDLYYRISGVCLRLPPLRQRRQDIPVLTDHFLRKWARDFRRPVPELSAETLQLFHDYSWPGNLRELGDAAKALVALGDENVAMGGLRALLRGSHAAGNGSGISLKEAARAASREAEKDLILKVLTRTRWNRRRAAKELQISYKALLYKLKQIGYEGYGAS
jgi:two-component system, NtrC family, response regulator AtoC